MRETEIEGEKKKLRKKRVKIDFAMESARSSLVFCLFFSSATSAHALVPLIQRGSEQARAGEM